MGWTSLITACAKRWTPYFDWQEFGSLLLQSTPPNTLLFAEGTFELQFALFRIPDEENAVFMIGPWATAERSEKSRSWARRHIGEKGDDAVQSYYNGVRILSDSGFQASIVAVVSMMFPKEEFHLDQQKEFLPFHFTTDLRYFTEPEFQREIPIQMLDSAMPTKMPSGTRWLAATPSCAEILPANGTLYLWRAFFRLTVPDQDHADRNEHSAAQSH